MSNADSEADPAAVLEHAAPWLAEEVANGRSDVVLRVLARIASSADDDTLRAWAEAMSEAVRALDGTRFEHASR